MSMRLCNVYHTYSDLDKVGAAFLTVLTRDDCGMYKVYSGIVRMPTTESETYEEARGVGACLVMRSGQSESYERAVTFFPNLPKDKYRL